MSGVGITPAIALQESPRERDIARPGISSCFSHTLSGPFGRPIASLNGSTRPLLLTIRSNSCGKVGLWSVVSGTAMGLPV